MKLKDITSKLNWKDIALGLGVAVVSVGLTNGYLKLEEKVGETMFCNDYGSLKGEPREVIDQSAAVYWPDIHPSNKERYFNNFAEWVNNCK